MTKKKILMESPLSGEAERKKGRRRGRAIRSRTTTKKTI
jgi:hypothetical protein